jgi:adenosylmethionine-8-amino-7-oxononanoate aminotransferase
MIEYDRNHIWHPYTSMTSPPCAYPVASAQGVRLRLEDGRELIDGMSSWWCAIHGYNHPVLNAAVEKQLNAVAHVMFGGLTHEPAVELAKKLIGMTSDPLQHVFFSDSGSVSVEVAIKMALQYWFNTGKAGKSRLLTIRGGYHGDTFGARGGARGCQPTCRRGSSLEPRDPEDSSRHDRVLRSFRRES